MAKDLKFSLSKEEREEMLGEIKQFFVKERDEEIGDLAADIVLDFIIDKMSDKFYNKGIYDSYIYLNDKASDLLELQR